MQSQGIGKILLNYAKDKRNKLHLNVYQKNARAISFYKREGFEIQHSGLDEATGEKDYVMTWQHKQKFQLPTCPLREEKALSQRAFSIYCLENKGYIIWKLDEKKKEHTLF